SPMVAADKPLNPNQLPSGGKFTHGTSGSININGNNMYINGNQQNSVIQWGGGFSIGKDAQVHFGKGQSGQNYLNIAHGTSKSTIEGILNAGGNNVFLINPNGVIIEKSGSIINAKNFMASTATLSNDDFNTFKNLSFDNPQAFSPKIKPNSGNVVNLGKINSTDSITLQGNKIVLEAGFDKGSLNKIETNKLNLKGNEVYVDVGTTKVQKVNVEAGKGTLYLSATGYYYDPKRKYNEFNNVDNKIKKTYNQYISIGSDVDWWHFAKGWNEKADFRNNVAGNTFKLTNDIDFGGNQGKGQEGKDWQNYANYCIDGLGCTNMIVGHTTSFDKTFDGQGYTLSNIIIDTTKLSYKPGYVGIFGSAKNATFENITIDYNNGIIKATTSGNVVGGVGSFVGNVYKSSFNNINLSNVKKIEVNGDNAYVGGFVGMTTQGDYTNVGINSIGEIFNNANKSNNIGGFVGSSDGAKFTNIFIDTINSIKGESKDHIVYAGSFAGRDTHSKFQNITIRKISNIDVTGLGGGNNSVGGFIGSAKVGDKAFDNIVIDGIDKITVNGAYWFNYLGGFIGSAYMTSNNAFNNIVLKNMGNMRAKADNGSIIGGFIGHIYIDKSINKQDILFNNVYMHYNNDAKFIVDSKDHTNTHYGKFIAHNSNYGETINYNTTNVYFYGNPINTAGKYDKYIDKNVGNFNDPEFQNGMNSIKGSNFDKDSIKPSEKEYLSAQEAKNDQATLTQDDLYESIVRDIFNSLKGHSYAIDLNTLQAFLEAYDKLSDTKSKVEFLSNFLLDKSKYTKKEREILAHSLVQSMDFILAYSKNDAKDSKFESGVETTFENLKDEAGNKHSDALKQGEALRAYVKSLINPVNSIKNNNKDITSNNTEIKRLQDEYNSLVNSINKGLLDENELSIAQKRLNLIVASIEVLLEKNEKLQDENIDLLAQIKIDKDNFRTYGVSSSTPETPTLSAVIINPSTNNGNDNNGDTSNGSDASQVVSSLQKQDSDKLSNTAVVDEEEKNEVEEASLMQKGKICIVSDNSKTMNPCIVGGL
ncbi:filamentous hemagglutinin N-terminal domain-containing protein, partial [Campylobacter sp. RKI_CA19_01116]|uniref:two-partner secretion domain-containing protein n=1 Tax=Campylobacter sp. RKI_CA19_01116 TaxID=2911625 RepID=UPI0021E703C5